MESSDGASGDDTAGLVPDDEESRLLSPLSAEKNELSKSSSVEAACGDMFGRATGTCGSMVGTKSGMSSKPDVRKNGRYTGSCTGGVYA